MCCFFIFNIISFRFTADSNTSILRLNFDEPVNIDTLSTSEITFQSSSNLSVPSSFYTLTAAESSVTYGLMLVIEITEQDLNRIKQLPDLFTCRNDLFISITSSFISDIRFNPIVPIDRTRALSATSPACDDNAPRLRFFHLDMDADQITLSFSETMNISSINFTAFTIQAVSDTTSIMDKSYRLTNGYIVNTDNLPTVIFNITLNDMNNIKSLRIAESNLTSYLVMDATAIQDMSLHQVIPLINGLNARLADEYTVDRTPPVLNVFDINMNTGILVLSFSETVYPASLNTSDISLQPEVDVEFSNLSVSLSTSMGITTKFGPIIWVRISNFDLNEVKRRTDLATSSDNTFITARTSAIHDMQQNYLVPVENGRAKQTSGFIQDSTPPTLSSFSLDIDSPQLNLSFSETVNAASLNTTLITLQRYLPSNFLHRLTAGLVVLRDGDVISMFLDDYDINLIKRNELCRGDTLTDCSIQLMTSAILDMNNNPINTTGVISVSPYPLYPSQDMTRPTLISFSLDMNSGILNLTFSEVIRTIYPSRLTLAATMFETSLSLPNINSTDPNRFDNSRSFLHIDGTAVPPIGTNFYPGHPPVISLTLIRDQLNILKSMELVAASNSSTYLYMTNTSAFDFRDNQLVALTPGTAAPVQVYVSDATRPELSSFSLDINSGLLTLQFSETVNATSLSPSAISFQGDVPFVQENSIRLSGGSTSSYDNPEILFQLSINDLNEIKRLTKLATDINNTYISITADLVNDQDENEVVPIAMSQPRPISSLTNDTTPPNMVSWSLDLNTGLVNLTFDETALSMSLNISEISLNSNSFPLRYHTLINATILSPDSIHIAFRLSVDDLDTIKLLEICTRIMAGDDCYMNFSSNLITDMEDNPVVPRNGFKVVAYNPDSTGPELIGFSVNMSSAVFDLTFSETVRVSTVSVSALTLHHFFAPPSTDFSITGGSILTGVNGLTLKFSLTPEELDQIKRITNLYTTRSNSFLSSTSSLIRDMDNNSLVPVSYRLVDSYTPDEIPPNLIAFSLDMSFTPGNFSLTFDESILVSSIDFTKLTLQDYFSANQSFTLTDGTSSSDNFYIVSIRLTLSDYRAIQALEFLAHSINTTWISYDSTFLNDLSGNPIVPRLNGINALQAYSYIADDSRPTLVEFTILNLNDRTIVLSFSEPVNISSLIVEDLTLQLTQDATSSQAETHSLAGYERVNYVSSAKTSLTIHLLPSDYLALELSMIGEATTSTFLSLANGTILDMQGNPLIGRTRSNGLSASSISIDTNAPVLEKFDLDLNSGLLSLTFSQVIRADTALPQFLQFQGSANALAGAYSLTDGNVTTQDGFSINITLTLDDLNAVKARPNIASMRSNTFIAMAADFISHFFHPSLVSDPRIDVIALTAGNARLVSTFTPDTTPPIATAFQLDLDNGVIEIFFTETIYAPTFTPSYVVLLGGNSNVSFQLTTRNFLSGPTSSSQSFSSIIRITLSTEDLNDIKRLTNLGTSIDNTYLYLTINNITDMSDNQLEELSVNERLKATVVSPDTISPILTNFSLDINNGVMKLTFSETINASSLDLSRFLLTAAPFSTEQVILDTSMVYNSLYDYIVTVIISSEDLNEIKFNRLLATSLSDSFISIMSNGGYDMSRNVLVSNFPDAVPAFTYTLDTSSPKFVNFTLDLNRGLMNLTFDEVVDTTSFKPERMVLTSYPSNYTFSNRSMICPSYQLQRFTSIQEIDTTSVQVILSKTDVDNLKLIECLAISENTSYLTIQDTGVRDVSSFLNHISNTTIRSSRFIPDVTPPMLTNFIANLNDSFLLLSFDEPVNVTSLVPTRFILLAAQTRLLSFYRLTGGNSSSNNGLLITLDILISDLNEIKKLESLYANEFSSFLVVENGAISDMFGNPILEIPDSLALRADSLYSDIIQPVLVGYSLDMDEGILNLTFVETVDYSSLNTTALTLQSRFDSLAEEMLTLRGGTLLTPVDDTEISISFIANDLNELKFRRIGISMMDIFLTMTSSAIVDQFDNPNVALINGMTAFFPINTYIPDITPPALVEFSLDLDSSAHLNLTFSETIQSSTLNVSQITLQHSVMRDLSNPDSFHTFTTSYTMSPDGLLIELVLSEQDLNEIKRKYELAISTSTTYISITSATILDVFGNPNEAIPLDDAKRIRSLILDSTPPELISFSLDLTTELLTLSLSEVVDASTLIVSEYTLHSDINANSNTSSYTLTPSSQLKGSGLPGFDSTRAVISLGFDDLNQIKNRTRLATQTNDTFLSITRMAIRDMTGNLVTETLKRVDPFVSDQTSPTLLRFALNLDTGVISLTFDEIIQASTLNESEIILSDQIGSMATSYMLSGSEFKTPSNEVEVDIRITKQDLDNIKALPQLAANSSTSFITFNENLVSDMNNNPIIPISSNSSNQTYLYTEDMTPPQLVYYNINLTNEVLEILFSETVNLDTLMITMIMFSSLNSSSATRYTLSGGVFNRTYDPLVRIQLDIFDLNEIKKLPDLLTNENNVFLTFPTGLVRDANSNAIQGVSPSSAQRPQQFFRDITPPRLLEFSLDMDGSGHLNLTFSETINVESLDVTQLVLEDITANPVENYTLTSSTVAITPNDTLLILDISIGDMNALKKRKYLTNSTRTTFLSLTSLFIQDTFGNEVVPVTSRMAMRIIPDETNPNLINFSLDLDSGYLTLYFDETTLGESLQPNSFILQSLRDENSTFVQLSVATPHSLHRDPIQVITILNSDLNEIKRLTDLATRPGDTFLSIDSLAIVDYQGNQVNSIPRTNAAARSILNYTIDETMPTLVNFDLDLDNETLVLSFSETVNSSSINVWGITLQGRQNGIGSEYYTLFDSTVISPDSHVITIRLNFQDLNAIKIRRNLASYANGSNTFISFPAFVRDQNFNEIVNISFSSAKRVQNITLDTTRPRLDSFILDLNAEVLNLTFSEVVESSSLNVTTITIQNLNGSLSHVLRGDLTLSRNDNYIISIKITVRDLNELKRVRNLADSEVDTYIALTSDTIQDMNGNKLYFVAVLQAAMLIPDLTSPPLDYFDINLTSNQLTLVFFETVDASSLSIQNLTLQDRESLTLTDPAVQSANYLTLTGGTSSMEDSTVLIVNLTRDDTNYIKRYFNLVTNSSNTFISFPNVTLVDMNSNPVVEISSNFASEVRNFTADAVRPYFYSFQLNLTSETLTLFFSETVLLTSINLTEITISNRNNVSYTLTSGQIISSISDIVLILLNFTDLNQLKNITSLAVSMDTTYLSTPSSFLTDTFLNPIVPISMLITASFFQDVTMPSLIDFDFDLNKGSLTLHFSEIVNATSLIIPNILIQSNTNLSIGTSYRLTNSSSTNSYNDITVTVSIGDEDLNAIKALPGLASSPPFTFLYIAFGSILDMNNNLLESVSQFQAKEVRMFTADITHPMLRSYILDLDSEILMFTFSETLNTSTFNITDILLHSPSSAYYVSYRLTLDSRLIAGQVDSTIYTVKLGISDLNEIKRLSSLATSLNTTFLSLTNLAVSDMADLSLVPVDGMRVREFISDMTSPELDTFQVNMNSGVLTLFFSETVNASTFQIQELKLQNNVTASNFLISLFPPTYSSSEDSNILTVTLGFTDLNKLTAAVHMYNFINDSYLVVTNSTVLDMNGNSLVPRLNTNAIMTSNFTQDVTRPTLFNYSVNFDSGQILFSFDETILIGSIIIPRLRILCSSTGSPAYNLTDGKIGELYANTFTLNLSKSDIDSIKLIENCWTNISNTFLLIESNALTDTSPGANAISQAIHQSSNTPIESLGPRLLSYTVNMTRGVLTLLFSEPVRPSNLVYTRFSLRSGQFNSTSSYSLTNGTTILVNGLQVQVFFTFSDLNNIKAREFLFTSNVTSYLYLMPGAIVDMRNNPSVATVSALPVSQFIMDIISPYLVSYVADLNSGVLNLTFSETVNVSSIDISLLVLQEYPSVDAADEHSYHRLRWPTYVMSQFSVLDSRLVALSLSLDDLNEIKRKEIGRSNTTLWLVIEDGALFDMNRRSVLPLLNGSSARPPDLFFPDITSPKLNSSILNMNNGTLTLFFSETVRLSTLNVTQLTLQSSGDNPTQYFTLTNLSGTLDTDAPFLTITIGSEDLNRIKFLSQLAIDTNTTFISITSSFITDMYGNPIQQILFTSAQRTFEYIRDTTNPEIIAFDLDIDSGNLTLVFSETVNASSLDVTKLTLQNSELQTDPYFISHVFTSNPPYPVGSQTFNIDSTVLVVSIGSQDLNEIKKIRSLGTNSSNTYLSYGVTVIQDMNRNFASFFDPLKVRNFTEDITNPELRSYGLDLNLGLLNMTFSETVKVNDTLDLTQIRIQSTRSGMDNPLTYQNLDGIFHIRENSTSLMLNGTDLIQYPFLQGSFTGFDPLQSYSISEDGTVVSVHLGFIDLNAIKYKTLLADKENGTFLALTNLTIRDLNDNYVTKIPITNAQPTRYLIPDQTSPILLRYDLNLDLDLLSLTFDEFVESSSLKVEYLTIQSGTLSNNSYHYSPRTLTPGQAQSHTINDDGHIIVVRLGAEDRNEIKRRQALAIDKSSSYLVAESSAIIDMAGNNLTAIPDGEALQVNVYTRDMTTPKLVNMSIDMDQGIFVLTFNETVDASTIVLTSISLQDSQGTNNSHKLTNGLSSNSDGIEVSVVIAIDDLNTIKRLIICRLPSQCFISYEGYTIRDMAGNPIVVRPNSEAFGVSQHLPDDTSPRLLMFSVNLTEEVIVLTFSETVNATTLDHTAFTLQDFFDPTTSYTLTVGINIQTEYSTVVVLKFSLYDLNLIKNNTDLFTGRPNAWLTMTMFAIRDMAFESNFVVPITSSINFGDGLVTELFVPDLKRPELTHFDLDMNRHLLYLFFTETVLASSLDFNQMTIQNRKMQNITEFHSLSIRNTLLTPNSPSLTIQLNQYDTDIIKAFTKLATTPNNTYISLSDSTFEDMNSNRIVEISFTNAVPVRTFTPDSTHPTLLAFDLNMNTGVLVLTFSEAVNVFTLNVSELRLQGSSEVMSEYHTLTPGLSPNFTLTKSANVAIIEVIIGTYDLNAIKKLFNLATSPSNTYISLSTRAVADMIGNPVIGVSTNNATRVSLFTPDTISPTLISYDINMNSELILLTFDETVNIDSFDASQISIQSNLYTHLVSLISFYRLTSGSYPDQNLTTIALRFDLNDINLIKGMTSLMTSEFDTFITFSTLLVEDVIGNSIQEIINGRGERVRIFTPDTVPPQVRSFHLDMDRGLLMLTFRETVNGSSLYVQTLVLQNTQNSSTFYSRRLTSSSIGVDLSYDTVVNVQLNIADLDNIKSIDNFALDLNNTWLTWNSTLVRDMNGNRVVPRFDGGALMAAIFTADTTPPYLIQYSFNFITEEITFEFNEPMEPRLVNFFEITLQDGLLADDKYRLTNGTVTAYNEFKVFIIVLVAIDWSVIKLNPSLTTSRNDTFISFGSNAFYDKATVPNGILPLVDGVNATQVSSFTYYLPPEFTSLRPTAGRSIGGTKITVVGSNFGSLAGFHGEREVEVSLAGQLTLNTTVTQNNTELMAYTPRADSSIVGVPITLRLTVDKSTLFLDIARAFTYLAPPVFTRIFPIAGSRFGSTFVTIYGQNFGPSTASQEGPVVSVTISGKDCTNLTVIDNYTLTCNTPSLSPSPHDINITVDQIATTARSSFRGFSPPVVLSITPPTTYKSVYTQVNITGRNFGPTGSSKDGLAPVVIFYQSEDNSTLTCLNVTVLVNDTLLSCVVPPGLGFSTISVSVDRTISVINPNVTFVHYDDAGTFSFSSAQFSVGELSDTGFVSVIRHDYEKYAGPAYVTVRTYDSTAFSNSHYINTTTTYLMRYDVFSLTFNVSIIAQGFQPSRLRMGVEDDVSLTVSIDIVSPVFGSSQIGRRDASLTIKAICEILSSFCVADLTTVEVEYYRTDELT